MIHLRTPFATIAFAFAFATPALTQGPRQYLSRSSRRHGIAHGADEDLGPELHVVAGV